MVLPSRRMLIRYLVEGITKSPNPAPQKDSVVQSITGAYLSIM
jgi:hypothetical protein